MQKSRTFKLILIFFGVLFNYNLFGQSNEDIDNLRTEILLNMEDENNDLQSYLNYYAKKSPVESKFLEIKKELLQGNFSYGIEELYKLKNTVKGEQNTLIQFQYNWLLLQIDYLLGIEKKSITIPQINSGLSTDQIKVIIELIICKESFDLINKDVRKIILKKGISDNINKYQKNTYLISRLYYYLGDYYLKNNKIDSSLYYFNQSNSFISKNKLPVYLSDYNNLEIHKINYKKHQLNNQEYKEIINHLSIQNKPLDVFYAIDYYKFINTIAITFNDFKTLNTIHPIIIDLLSINQDNKMKGRAILMDKMSKDNLELIESSKKKWFIIYGLLLLCVLLSLIYLFIKRRKKDQFSELIEEDNTTKIINISDKTEDKILIKLIDFEQKHKYIQKNISLKSLALLFDTNPRYISEIINKHKHTNFSNYINDLRIDYIVNKLESDVEYRKYKVSYLAETCGFSSHSLFTTIFKNKVGVSPIEFIQKLKNNE